MDVVVETVAGELQQRGGLWPICHHQIRPGLVLGKYHPSRRNAFPSPEQTPIADLQVGDTALHGVVCDRPDDGFRRQASDHVNGLILQTDGSRRRRDQSGPGIQECHFIRQQPPSMQHESSAQRALTRSWRRRHQDGPSLVLKDRCVKRQPVVCVSGDAPVHAPLKQSKRFPYASGLKGKKPSTLNLHTLCKPCQCPVIERWKSAKLESASNTAQDPYRRLRPSCTIGTSLPMRKTKGGTWSNKRPDRRRCWTSAAGKRAKLSVTSVVCTSDQIQ